MSHLKNYKYLGGVHPGRDESALDLGNAPALHVVERGDEAVGLGVFPKAPHLESEVIVDAGEGGGANEAREQGGEKAERFHFEFGGAMSLPTEPNCANT